MDILKLAREARLTDRPRRVIDLNVFAANAVDLQRFADVVLEAAKTRVLEQRCERDTPWDLAVLACADAICAMKGAGNG